MKTGTAKTRASYQKDVNRLREQCHKFQKALKNRNTYISNAVEFIDAMLEQGKITKEDLKPYFKKKPKV